MKRSPENLTSMGIEHSMQRGAILASSLSTGLLLTFFVFSLIVSPKLCAQYSSAPAGSLHGSTLRAVSTNATLAAKSLEIYKDESGVIEIELENTIPVVAFQFDVKINPSVSVGVIEAATRTTGMTIASGKISEGVYRVICYSIERKNIVAGTDAVVRMNVSFPTDVVPGVSDIVISDAVVTINLEMDEAVVTTSKGTLTIKDILYGDSNQDGKVDVNDVVNLVNYIVTGASDQFNFKASDMNKDARINVTDIIGIVAIILRPDNPAPSFRSGSSGVYELSEQGFVLDNAPLIAGFEFAYDGDFIPSPGVKNFTTVKYEKEGEKRILAYSLTGGADLNGKRLFEGVTSMRNQLFVSPSGEEIALSEGGITVGVSEQNQNGQKIFASDKKVIIDGFKAGEHYTITTLSGQIITKGSAKAQPLYISLPNGHYLVTVGHHSQKVIVR